ncbi:Mbeg1-like protein [Clostridium felsineum]|nr:Mbeg1-like protein [Clostridium felsineum]
MKVNMRDIKDNDYNMLTILSYVDLPSSIKSSNGIENYYIGDMVSDYLKDEKKLLKLEGRCNMSYDEWKHVLQAIKSSNKLCSLKIVSYTNQDSTSYTNLKPKANGLVAYCFETSDYKGIIDYRGSETRDKIGGEDWYDNFLLAFEIDTPQQKAALEFFQCVKNRYGYTEFSTIGHSKGGNDAQYVAVKGGQDIVKRTVTFDAPGFNFKFIESNKRKICEIRSKIIAYMSYRDYVSSVLNNISGHIISLKTDKVSTLRDNHKPNIFLKLIYNESGDAIGYKNFNNSYGGEKNKDILFSEITLLTNIVSVYEGKKEGAAFADGIYNILLTKKDGKRRENFKQLFKDRRFLCAVIVTMRNIKKYKDIIAYDYIFKEFKSRDSFLKKLKKLIMAEEANDICMLICDLLENLSGGIYLLEETKEILCKMKKIVSDKFEYQNYI